MLKKFAAIAVMAGTMSLSMTSDAKAGDDAYIGEITILANSYCPRNTLPADGSLIQISQNAALFSVIGTSYGGDGRTTFALPNLQGRMPMHLGTSPQMGTVLRGQMGGAPTTTLSVANLPSHTHTASSSATSTLMASSAAPTTNEPQGANLGTFPAGANIYTTNGGATEAMATGNVATTVTTTIGATGAGAPATTISPFLVLRFCVVTQGLFPPRN